MCSYFSKSESESSLAMQKAVEERSLRKCFHRIRFANGNLPEKRYRICKS